jgi:aminopeptidase N
VIAAEELPPILRQWILARAPRIAVAGADAALREAALALATRLFERTPLMVPVAQLDFSGREPVVIAGRHAEIDAELARRGLPARPAHLAGRGSAQVWTIAAGTGRAPVAVISARDAASLRALLRPLPHYGSQSYLAFDGARAIERGVWPAPGRLIAVSH